MGPPIFLSKKPGSVLLKMMNEPMGDMTNFDRKRGIFFVTSWACHRGVFWIE